MAKKQVKNIISYILLSLIIIAISGFLSFNYLLDNVDNSQHHNQVDYKESVAKNTTNKEFNLLLVGADKSQNGQARSDTLMVANVDLKVGKISIIFIPRDTRVKLTDGQYHKINAAYAYGGVKAVHRTVAQFLGIGIDYYLKINYNDFIDLVDLLGGIELEVEKRLHYNDQAGNLNIDLTAGEQSLDGEQALDYVRFRHDHLGDIGRIKRQQKFLTAVSDKLFTPATIFKFPELLNKVRNTMETNLSVTDFSSLAELVKNFDSTELKTITLPGEAGYIEGISYWLVKKNELDTILSSF